MQGRKSNAILDQALTAVCCLNHRGAAGAEARHRRRRGRPRSRSPTRSTARSSPFELPPAGAYATGIAFLPVDDVDGATRRGREGARSTKASRCSAGATCRSTPTCPGKSAREVMPAFGRCSSRRTASPATSSSATCTSRASASSTSYRHRGGVYFPSLSARVVVLQGHAHARPAPALLPRPPATRASRPRSRSCTRASPPTRSRAGRSRTRTGCWRTTARSTRCRATRTGCAPAKA